MKKISLLTIFGLLSLFIGCASVPMAPTEQDAEAKQFTVLQGKSNIYLYRNESFGGGVAVPVTLDGKNVGSTGPYTYFKWVVEPGKHVVVSNPKDGKPTRVIVHAVEGKNHFLWQEITVDIGFLSTYTGSTLHVMSDEEGMKDVNECKLIHTEVN